MRSRSWRLLAPLLLSVTRAVASGHDLVGDLRSSARAADPLEHLLLTHPAPASVYASPVGFLFEANASDFDTYKVVYQSTWACVQVDEYDPRCIPLTGAENLRLRLSVGEHSVRVFVTDTDIVTEHTKRRHVSDPISFTVVSPLEFEEYMQRQLALEHERLGVARDEGLLEWTAGRAEACVSSSNESIASGSRSCGVPPTDKQAAPEPVFLVIGVKTSVVDGFPFRQAIRQTWASATSLPADVKVWFAGCRPLPLRDHAPDYLSDEVNSALEVEKRVYGDFLTSELDCDDGYPGLANKVKQFMHYAATRYRSAKYVMIADDDIYLRVSILSAELKRLGEPISVYAGSSRAKQYLHPIRDEQLRYFIPESVYPMDEFPPFALGPHYLLSMDCVQFIAENRDDLQGLGAVDDVSVALWMLAIQVHPQHIDEFRSLRSSRCRDEILSFADLSPLAMHLVHENLRQGLGLCHGLNRILWDKLNVGRR